MLAKRYKFNSELLSDLVRVFRMIHGMSSAIRLNALNKTTTIIPDECRSLYFPSRAATMLNIWLIHQIEARKSPSRQGIHHASSHLNSHYFLN